ncbi:MAG: hypothetical protein WCW65_02670 [Candidatus Paceibacterota bacterium]
MIAFIVLWVWVGIITLGATIILIITKDKDWAGFFVIAGLISLFTLLPSKYEYAPITNVNKVITSNYVLIHLDGFDVQKETDMEWISATNFFVKIERSCYGWEERKSIVLKKE